MDFKDRLKEIRKANGYSQVELAEAIGVSKSTIGAYETGDITPSLEKIYILANYFNVEASYFIEETSDNANGMRTDDEKKITEIFASNVKKLRKKRGLSQTDLASALSVSTSSISMYERAEREPSLKMLVSLAEYFGVTIDSLFKEDENEEYRFNQTTLSIATTIFNRQKLFELFNSIKGFSDDDLVLLASFAERMKK